MLAPPAVFEGKLAEWVWPELVSHLRAASFPTLVKPDVIRAVRRPIASRPLWLQRSSHLRRTATWPHHPAMRMLLLRLTSLTTMATMATLAVACGYRVDDCDQPAKAFSVDQELDELAIKRLVSDSQVIDRSQLECDIVCEFIYLDQHPKGGANEVEVCKLTIDGDFTGDPQAVVGSIYCEGRGVPQFCVDA